MKKKYNEIEYEFQKLKTEQKSTKQELERLKASVKGSTRK